MKNVDEQKRQDNLKSCKDSLNDFIVLVNIIII